MKPFDIFKDWNWTNFWKINLLVICFAGTVKAQVAFNWAKGVGNADYEYGFDVTVDPSGNVYSIGTFSSVVDFDPGPGTFTLASTGNTDVFILKLDAAGNFVSANKLGGVSYESCSDIFIDPTGNIYVAGSFSLTTDLDPGPSTYTLLSAGNTDVFVAKYDPMGNFIWGKSVGGPGSDNGTSVGVDASGNVYFSGVFNLSADFDPGTTTYSMTSSGSVDAFVVKLNSSGNFIWAGKMGGPSGDGCEHLEITPAGEIIVTGSFQGSADMDPSAGSYSLVSLGVDDGYIVKINPSGTLAWAKQIGGASNDQSWVSVVDPSGNVFVGGIFSMVGDMDPGPATYSFTSAGSYDGYILKLDASGNFVWAKQFAGPLVAQPLGIDLDGSGNIYSAGIFSGSADFDPGPGSFSLTSIGSNEVYVSKLDASGNFIWAGRVGGTLSEDCGGLVVDPSNNIYVAGTYQNGCDFDPGPSTYSLSVAGNIDTYIFKLESCSLPAQPGAISGSNKFCYSSGFQTYSISPTAGATSYSWSLPGGWTGTSTTNIISVTPGLSGGTLSVAATNTCGTSLAAALSITVNPLPSVTANSSSVCAGTSGCLSVNSIAAATYTWVGPCGFVTNVQNPCFTFNLFCNCTYTVMVADANNCVNTATTCLNVCPNPTVTAITSNSLICGPPFQGTATLTGNGASTYFWNTSATTSAIAVSPSVTTTYTVTGTDANGCMNTATVTQNVSACTGINGLSYVTTGIAVFPNPTKGILKVVVPENFTGTPLEIYNAIGEKIFKGEIFKNFTDIDLSGNSAGIYFIRIGNVTEKILKEN